MFGKFQDTMEQMKLVQKMLSDKNFRILMQHPKVQEIFRDPEIQKAIRDKEMNKLTQHPKMTALRNDPELTVLLAQVDFQSWMK